MGIIKTLVIILLFSSTCLGQCSYYSVTTLVNGKKVNIRKDGKRYIRIYKDGDVSITGSNGGGGTTYRSDQALQSAMGGNTTDGCTTFFTNHEITNRLVMWTKCENEATPYIKRQYLTDRYVTTKVTYFYYDD
jgi:hypothetical protein